MRLPCELRLPGVRLRGEGCDLVDPTAVKQYNNNGEGTTSNRTYRRGLTVSDAVLVLTTVPSADVGEQIGRALVEAGLAACVNIFPPMVSVYRWRGALHRDDECQVVIKTIRDRVDEVQARVSALHPYDLPEFLVLPVEGGNPAYLAWVRAESSNPAL